MNKIEVLGNKVVSYIFHLQAIAKINYDNEYSIKYKDFLCNSDFEILKSCKNELTFGDGYTGLFANVFIFYPCYIAENDYDFNSYFTSLKKSLKQNDYQILYDKFKNKFSLLEQWIFSKEQLEYYIRDINLKSTEKAIKLINVFIKNYQAYESVWVKENVLIEEIAYELKKQLARYDLVTRWESYTGIKFKISPYQIILSPSLDNGPNANSLGYEKNVFNLHTDNEHIIHFISHEVGTHIMIDEFKSIFNSLNEDDFKSEVHNPSIYYSAYENLAQFYNKKILSDCKITFDLGDDYNSNAFQEIYNALHKKLYSIREMITNSVKIINNKI